MFYENIGGKIKILARVLCVLGIIGSFVSGILFIVASSEIGTMHGVYIICGIAIIVVGSILSWIATWLLYAFGDITENVAIIKKKVCRLKVGSEKRDDELLESEDEIDTEEMRSIIDELDSYGRNGGHGR